MVGQGELDRYVNYFTGKKPYRGKALKVSTTNQYLVLKKFFNVTKEDMNFAFNKIYASKRFGPRRLKDIKAALTTFWDWLYKDDDNAKRGRHGHAIAVDWFKDNGTKARICMGRRQRTETNPFSFLQQLDYRYSFPLD
jgi:hypothetical protein